MKKALLATKEERWIDYYSTKKVGDIVEYKTTRTAIVEKLIRGDLVYLRVQGTGDVTMKLEFIEKTGAIKKRVLFLKIKKIYFEPTPTKEFYIKRGIKAGAEHGWVKEDE